LKYFYKCRKSGTFGDKNKEKESKLDQQASTFSADVVKNLSSSSFFILFYF